MTSARALWTIAEGVAELRTDVLPEPGNDEVLVRTLFSGISRGTERLVFHGKVPESERQRMRAPLMGGDFPFPVKYGYAAVGMVEAGAAAWLGKTVFALAPHQDRQIVPVSLIAEVPANVPPQRAVLAANMETALNAVWDSGAGPGDAITIVGAGIVGLLIARLCAKMPGTAVTVVDVDAGRASIVERMGARFAGLLAPRGSEDVVFHTSATAQGLETALDSAAYEGTVVEVSWYGARSIAAPLGGAFHSQRLRLVSSQVGNVAASRRPRWDYARRRAKALDLLDDGALDMLVTEEIAFADAAGALPRILAPGAPGLQTIIRY